VKLNDENTKRVLTIHDKHAEFELYAYRATKIYAAVCITITPSPAGFDVFIHLALNQFS